MKSYLIASTAIVLAGSMALAETYDVSGTGYGTEMNEVTPISEDLTVIHGMSQYDRFEAASADSPMATLSGPCFGSILINAGTVSGGGYCSYTDGDGDMAVMSWTAEGLGADGRTTGSWSIAGGTGKWQGATGGGTFLAGADAEGNYSNEITGEMTMP